MENQNQLLFFSLEMGTRMAWLFDDESAMGQIKLKSHMKRFESEWAWPISNSVKKMEFYIVSSHPNEHDGARLSHPIGCVCD